MRALASRGRGRAPTLRSPFRSKLRGTETFTAVTGLSTANAWFENWSTPSWGSVWAVATTSDPLWTIYYSVDIWDNVANGTWTRHGNSGANETAIMASTFANFPNSHSGPDRSRFNYHTNSTSSRVVPSPPAFVPWPHPPPQIRMPTGLQPPNNSDGYLAVRQPDGTVADIYCAVVLSANRLVCWNYGITSWRTGEHGRHGGTTASCVPVHAGMIVDDDDAASAIDHALAVSMGENWLSQAATGPALTWDYPNAYSGAVPMGARLALPPATDLGSRSWESAFGQKMGVALKDYGCFVTDRNGGSGVMFRQQSNTAVTALQSYGDALFNDATWCLQRLQRVT